MRFYHYRATDRNGRPVEGTMQAASPDEARRALTGAGMRVADVREAGTPAPQAPRPTPPSRPAPRATPPVSSPLPTSRPPTPAPRPVPAAPAPSVDVVHTALGSDKDRFFLFSQLAAALRAGINPAQAFTDIAPRSKGQFADSLREAAQATGAGRPISDTLARYPDLYPEGVVGTVRAGETGGFLPEAFEEIARQAESAHAFKRWFFWIWFVVINALLSIPGMWIATRALLATWDAVDAKGGTGAGGGMMSLPETLRIVTQSFLKSILWPWGPITLVVWLALALLRRYFGSRIAKRFRHRIGLRYPVFGKRARHENLSRFAWTMSRVARAGVSPARAWQLSAESVPNLEMRDILARIGAGLTGAERLSDVVFQSRVFPEEYAPVVATAEYTGDLPGAMQQLANMSGTEFVAAQNYAKARSGCWGALGCFMTSAIMLGILFWAWYHELPAKVLQGFGD